MSTVKKIAELVRAGAVLTSYMCPACGSVLVKLKTGELYCANCERPVILAKSEEEAQQAVEIAQLRDVRRAVFNKILQLGQEIEKLNADELMDNLKSMSLLLDIYERLSKFETPESQARKRPNTT